MSEKIDVRREAVEQHAHELECFGDITHRLETNKIAAMLRELRLILDRIQKIHSTVSAENVALLDRAERAERDTARLDWLAANPRITEVHTGGKIEHGHAYVVSGHTSFSLRQIIDACMNQPSAPTPPR